MTTQLQFNDWVEFLVQDPTQHNKYGYPIHVATVFIFVNRSWNDMNNDHHKPQSQQVDDATVYITDDSDEAWNHAHGKGRFTRYVCANCGSGLGLTSCFGCGAEFRDDHSRMGASMPMPRKMVAFLQSHGHEFSQDPEIVWKKEV